MESPAGKRRARGDIASPDSRGARRDGTGEAARDFVGEVAPWALEKTTLDVSDSDAASDTSEAGDAGMPLETDTTDALHADLPAFVQALLTACSGSGVHAATMYNNVAAAQKVAEHTLVTNLHAAVVDAVRCFPWASLETLVAIADAGGVLDEDDSEPLLRPLGGVRVPGAGIMYLHMLVCWREVCQVHADETYARVIRALVSTETELCVDEADAHVEEEHGPRPPKRARRARPPASHLPEYAFYDSEGGVLFAAAVLPVATTLRRSVYVKRVAAVDAPYFHDAAAAAVPQLREVALVLDAYTGEEPQEIWDEPRSGEDVAEGTGDGTVMVVCSTMIGVIVRSHIGPQLLSANVEQRAAIRAHRTGSAGAALESAAPVRCHILYAWARSGAERFWLEGTPGVRTARIAALVPEVAAALCIDTAILVEAVTAWQEFMEMPCAPSVTIVPREGAGSGAAQGVGWRARARDMRIGSALHALATKAVRDYSAKASIAGGATVRGLLGIPWLTSAVAIPIVLLLVCVLFFGFHRRSHKQKVQHLYAELQSVRYLDAGWVHYNAAVRRIGNMCGATHGALGRPALSYMEADAAAAELLTVLAHLEEHTRMRAQDTAAYLGAKRAEAAANFGVLLPNAEFDTRAVCIDNEDAFFAKAHAMGWFAPQWYHCVKCLAVIQMSETVIGRVEDAVGAYNRHRDSSVEQLWSAVKPCSNNMKAEVKKYIARVPSDPKHGSNDLVDKITADILRIEAQRSDVYIHGESQSAACRLLRGVRDSPNKKSALLVHAIRKGYFLLPALQRAENCIDFRRTVATSGEHTVADLRAVFRVLLDISGIDGLIRVSAESYIDELAVAKRVLNQENADAEDVVKALSFVQYWLTNMNMEHRRILHALTGASIHPLLLRNGVRLLETDAGQMLVWEMFGCDSIGISGCVITPVCAVHAELMLENMRAGPGSCVYRLDFVHTFSETRAAQVVSSTMFCESLWETDAPPHALFAPAEIGTLGRCTTYEDLTTAIKNVRRKMETRRFDRPSARAMLHHPVSARAGASIVSTRWRSVSDESVPMAHNARSYAQWCRLAAAVRRWESAQATLSAPVAASPRYARSAILLEMTLRAGKPERSADACSARFAARLRMMQALPRDTCSYFAEPPPHTAQHIFDALLRVMETRSALSGIRDGSVALYHYALALYARLTYIERTLAHPSARLIDMLYSDAVKAQLMAWTASSERGAVGGARADIHGDSVVLSALRYVLLEYQSTHAHFLCACAYCDVVLCDIETLVQCYGAEVVVRAVETGAHPEQQDIVLDTRRARCVRRIRDKWQSACTKCARAVWGDPGGAFSRESSTVQLAWLHDTDSGWVFSRAPYACSAPGTFVCTLFVQGVQVLAAQALLSPETVPDVWAYWDTDTKFTPQRMCQRILQYVQRECGENLMYATSCESGVRHAIRALRAMLAGGDAGAPHVPDEHANEWATCDWQCYGTLSEMLALVPE